jgi:hypothetical protein
MLSKKDERLRKKCVEHWQENLMMLQLNYYSKVESLGYDIDIFCDSCAFCKVYGGSNRCRGCPIQIKAGGAGCAATPWLDIADNHIDDYYRGNGYDIDFNNTFNDTFVNMGRMIDFLLSL